jgi:electron transfer flavoprotein beta subunit
MRVAVCVKQIPDPAAPYRLDAETHFIERPEGQVLDDTDRYGVEVALQLTETHGGAVTLVSMSPAGNLQGIRQAMAMGAERAVLVEDPSLRGADALTTARVLAAAIGRADADVVIAGTESTDGSTGLVPQQLAEFLGVPALTYARAVHVGENDEITIERQTAAGYDVVRARCPVLITVTSGVGEPRYPTFKGIMQAKTRTIDRLTCADVGVDPEWSQRIRSTAAIPARARGTIVPDEGEGHLRVLEKLQEAGVV